MWITIPLAIWLTDRGPIFFIDRRLGLNGKEFGVRKFRTMAANRTAHGSPRTEKEDARITGVGKILRRTALDEIPGFIAIWTGDMSLVGPRPMNVTESRQLEQSIPGFNRRLQVPPGLTGLSQLHNPGDDPALKLKLDLEYIQRRSLWLDLRILTASVSNSITGRWDQRTRK